MNEISFFPTVLVSKILRSLSLQFVMPVGLSLGGIVRCVYFVILYCESIVIKEFSAAWVEGIFTHKDFSFKF